MYLGKIICFGLLSAYVLLITGYIYGFIRIPTFKPPQKLYKNNPSKISVLIPFRNEQMNLPIIFDHLQKQTLQEELFEVIFIDDNSEDNSAVILKHLIKKPNRYRIISSGQKTPGKKQALETGIKHAKNNLIVLSDADCFHTEKWLETIYKHYSEHKPKMIIAPVLLSGPEKLFYNLQKLEFLSLTASTAGAAGINRPIMNNGANTVFEKNVFYEFNDAMNKKEVSGDDIFLLHNIKKKYPNSVHYLKSTDATVFTDAEINLKSFVKQRTRWASKSKSYKDSDAITVSLIVFLTNLILVGSFIYSLFNTDFFYTLLLLFLIKAIPDLTLLSISASFFKQTKYLLLFPLLSIIYPFYILFTAFSGLFVKQIQWK